MMSNPAEGFHLFGEETGNGLHALLVDLSQAPLHRFHRLLRLGGCRCLLLYSIREWGATYPLVTIIVLSCDTEQNKVR